MPQRCDFEAIPFINTRFVYRASLLAAPARTQCVCRVSCERRAFEPTALLLMALLLMALLLI
jgi:hypothetical protein